MTNQTPPFAVGQRIKLLDMPDDPDPIPPGTTGTVLAVSSWLTGDSWAVTVDWDIDHSLSPVVPPERAVIIATFAGRPVIALPDREAA